MTIISKTINITISHVGNSDFFEVVESEMEVVILKLPRVVLPGLPVVDSETRQMEALTHHLSMKLLTLYFSVL